MSNFKNGIISVPQRKQRPQCSLWVAAIFWDLYRYLFIYGKPSRSPLFPYSEIIFFSHFVKKPQQLPKFLSLKFGKGKTSQKLRAVKENVSVKNTGTKILLQFRGEREPQERFWGKIQQQLKGSTVGEKGKFLKPCSPWFCCWVWCGFAARDVLKCSFSASCSQDLSCVYQLHRTPLLLL